MDLSLIVSGSLPFVMILIVIDTVIDSPDFGSMLKKRSPDQCAIVGAQESGSLNGMSVGNSSFLQASIAPVMEAVTCTSTICIST